MKKTLIACILALGLGHPPYANAQGQAPSPSKIFLIILENADFEQAVSQPTPQSQSFLKRLASKGALLSQSFALTHPSYPNYLALTSGSTWGIQTSDQVQLNVRHLGDLLEEHKKSWKVYAEDYPGHCFSGAVSGAYVRRHVPFLSYKNVTDSPSRCGRRIVPAQELDRDIARRELPDFSLYIPNNKNNGHDGGIAAANRWLNRRLGPLMRDRRFTRDLVLIISFDEGTPQGPNRIYTAFWGKGIRSGTVVSRHYDHYDLLKTIEKHFGLGDLDQNDRNANSIDEVWAPKLIEYKASIEMWRQEREQKLRSPEGWLTLVGLYWLKEGENSFGTGSSNSIRLPPGSAPKRGGSLIRRGNQITLKSSSPDSVRLNGQAATEKEIRSDENRDPDRIESGRLVMVVLKRGDRFALRVKDPESPVRKNFPGIESFPTNSDYRIQARFTAQERTVPVPNILGTLDSEKSPGFVTFHLKGNLKEKELKLTPILEDGKLFFIFRDQTSGRSTYPSGRFLYAEMPNPNGEVILDFNQAYNPPCAFTHFATCPLPPRENSLAVPIEAGERYKGSHHL